MDVVKEAEGWSDRGRCWEDEEDDRGCGNLLKEATKRCSTHRVSATPRYTIT